MVPGMLIVEPYKHYLMIVIWFYVLWILSALTGMYRNIWWSETVHVCFAFAIVILCITTLLMDASPWYITYTMLSDIFIGILYTLYMKPFAKSSKRSTRGLNRI